MGRSWIRVALLGILLGNFRFGAVFAMLLDLMSAQVDPDAALMLRVREGDRDAFALLVDRYKQPVMNLVARTLRDLTEAEDVAQHVFLQVYKSAHRYEVTAKFSTWIFTIARNLCLNEIRRRSRHPADSIDATREGDEEHPARQLEDARTFSPPDTLLQRELEIKVDEAVNALPEKQRTALLLCRQEELSYEEIAKVLDCSIGTVSSRLNRGHKLLAQN